MFTNTEHDVRGTAALGVNTWTHVAAVYDASNLRIYVNGTQAASLPLSGAMVTSTGALRIGGNQPHGEWFAGLIDELRVYNRALTVTEIQRDMTTAVRPTVTDGQPPTAPSGLTANGGLGQAQLNWTAASDNVGVTRYNVHRGASAGFTPSAANRIAQPTGRATLDTGATAGTHFYRVTAEDAAGNVGPASNEAQAAVTARHRRAQRQHLGARRRRHRERHAGRDRQRVRQRGGGRRAVPRGRSGARRRGRLGALERELDHQRRGQRHAHPHGGGA